MIGKYLLGAGGMAIAFLPTCALAASVGYELRLSVPLHCTVQHQGIGHSASATGAVPLGTFREYCNSPRGYDLIVTYKPGALKGVRIIAGQEQITLDGSGRSVLSHVPGPRVRERMIAAIPGQNGFDTDRFELSVVPA